MEQKINDSKPQIWSLSFNFRFSNRKSQSQQKLPKRINLASLKSPRSFYEPQLTQHCKKHTPKHKNLNRFTSFSANMFLVVVSKNI